MNRKRTSAHPDESDPIAERQIEELKAELARANDQLAALGERLNLQSEKCDLAEKNQTERLVFETLLTEISANFINLPTDQIDAHIEDAQRRICECLDVGLSGLWQWSDTSPDVLTVTHLYGPPEAEELVAGIDARKAFPWVLERVSRGEMVVLPTESMPPEAAQDQESRRRFGAKSSLAIPLSAGGDPIIGVLDFNILKEERPWPDSIVKRLQLIAQMFTNALVRKQAELRLASDYDRSGYKRGSQF